VSALGPAASRAWNCRLTTTGRKSGQPRTVTLWFAPEGASRVYLAGAPDGPQWYRNLRVRPEVEIEIAGTRHRGLARAVEEPGAAAAIRDRFAQRYVLARLSRLFGGYTRSVAVEIDLHD
jgi:deazaflavin-dependent oxidoreductase (nitroreductase family)